MICPNCGSNMSDKKTRCDRCGMDMTIYRKIYRASNEHYNNGLARAKVRDLSGAIISLKNSLELNKMNTSARNLLGLIYYEMGETVAALSEWVISKHFQPTGNDADEYINKVQSNPTKLDALNQAIKRYNTALTLAKQGSGDLSIIQLKKVVSLNPHFIRAYHLLALLHMKINDNEKARKYLNKALKIDVSNTATLRYLKEMDAQEAADKDPDSNPEAENTGTGAIMPISSYREDKPNIIAYINLVIGVIIGIAVTALLVIPTLKKNQSADDQNAVDYGTISAQLEEKDNTIANLQNDLADQKKQVKELQTQIDGFEVPEENTGLLDPVFQAVRLYLAELEKPESSRDYNALADVLLTIDESKIESSTVQTLITTMRTVAYPEAARDHYDIGHDELYAHKKYEEALVELQKSMLLDPTDVDPVYFIARSYHRLGDKENAALYYNIVLTDFPESDRVSDAQDFLEQVTD